MKHCVTTKLAKPATIYTMPEPATNSDFFSWDPHPSHGKSEAPD